MILLWNKDCDIIIVLSSHDVVTILPWNKLCCYKVCLLHAWNINTLIVAKYLHVKPHSQPPTQLFVACWTVKEEKGMVSFLT